MIMQFKFGDLSRRVFHQIYSGEILLHRIVCREATAIVVFDFAIIYSFLYNAIIIIKRSLFLF